MSNLVCITSHCNNSEKIQFLKEKIKLLKQNKKNILLISHIPLDKDIVASVDHFIYDKINPLLQYPEKYSVVWKLININNDVWRLISYNPDYGWCHLNQLKIISNYCKKLQYETYTFFNYDTVSVTTGEQISAPQKIGGNEIIAPRLFVPSVIERNLILELISHNVESYDSSQKQRKNIVSNLITSNKDDVITTENIFIFIDLNNKDTLDRYTADLQSYTANAGNAIAVFNAEMQGETAKFGADFQKASSEITLMDARMKQLQGEYNQSIGLMAQPQQGEA